MNANETLKQALEWMKSPEGQKGMEDYFDKLTEKDRIQMERANKLLERYGVCDDSMFDYVRLSYVRYSRKTREIR